MTHVSLSDCLILILFLFIFQIQKNDERNGKNVECSCNFIIWSDDCICHCFSLEFRFCSSQISSILGKISCHRHVLRFSTNAQKYVKQHQTLNSLFGILFKRGVIVQMSRRPSPSFPQCRISEILNLWCGLVSTSSFSRKTENMASFCVLQMMSTHD